MCEAVSLSVVRLKRIRYGSLSLGTIREGQFRYLTETEVSELAGVPTKAAPAKSIKSGVGQSQGKAAQRSVPRDTRNAVEGNATPAVKSAEKRGRPGQDRKPFAPKTESGRRMPKKP